MKMSDEMSDDEMLGPSDFYQDDKYSIYEYKEENIVDWAYAEFDGDEAAVREFLERR